MEHRPDDALCRELRRAVHAALVIPNMTVATYVLDLVPPGAAYYGRQNQLDVGARKFFRIQRYQFSAQADVFNVLNVSYVKNQNVTLGSSFGQPLDVLQPRSAARGADEIALQGLTKENSERAARNIRPVRAVRCSGTAAIMRSSRQPCDGDGR